MISEQGFIAANRFGLGENPENMRRLDSSPLGWLRAQLEQGVRPLPGQQQSSAEIFKYFSSKRKKGASKEEKKKIRQEQREFYKKAMTARFQFSIETRQPFVERLVHFWSNHFTISVKAKKQLAPIAGAYEQEAIRPHVLGNFTDMMLAVYQHPAMLSYLDNTASFGPNSKIGQNRNKGLNENLAREILELHTLGVNGGYAQQDVIGLAKIITGWSLLPPKLGGAGFKFLNQAHEPGTHKLLGKNYSQQGQQQGVAAFQDLARHPSTARFIATKMARHFVSDNPSERSIQRLETTFRQTNGNLRAMAETLIDLAEIWQNPLPKFKTPYELIVSSMRMMGVQPKQINFKKIMQSLALFDHVPFSATSPAGWSDKAEDWAAPNAVMNRIEWCHAFAQIVRPKESPLEIAQNIIGPVAKGDTLLWIERSPSQVEGLALLLASPEWQRR